MRTKLAATAARAWARNSGAVGDDPRTHLVVAGARLLDQLVADGSPAAARVAPALMRACAELVAALDARDEPAADAAVNKLRAVL